MAHPMSVNNVNFAMGISPSPAARDTNDRTNGTTLPDEDQHLPSTGKPGVGSVEVSMGDEHVLAEAINERPTASGTDEIPDIRPQQLPSRRGHDDQDEIERVELPRNLATGQYAAEDDCSSAPTGIPVEETKLRT